VPKTPPSETSYSVVASSGGGAGRNKPGTKLQSAHFADDPDSDAWQIALAQVADLKSALSNNALTAATVDSIARRWGTSARTVWRRAKAFREEGSLRSILQRRRGPVAGVSKLDSVIETIISDTARAWWKATENATSAEIYPAIVRECAGRGLARPSRATVVRRLSVLRKDPANFSAAVAATLRDRSRLVKTSYTIERSLSVVQVDHTVADVFIVDPSSHKCIGRPTLTVAVDVATRCICGVCLSLESPSSLLVALCLENAVSPKQSWLRSLGLDLDWPVHGIPDALHTDNGREFHSAAFRRGCDLNGIDTIYRPPATPRFGGHVERLIGTLMRRIRLLPGNTYSDFLQARPKRAEARATLTLSELGAFLLEDVHRYHRNTHRSLGRPPLSAWEEYWGKQAVGPRLPKDISRFRLDFLPLQRRVIGREGIELFGLKYSCASLAQEVDLGCKRVVRYDPRDLSHVYLEQPQARHLAVPLRDPGAPALSLWELKAVKRSRWSPQNVEDPDVLRRAVEQVSEKGANMPQLRRNRRAARREAWRAVEKLADTVLPNTSLKPTLVSKDVESLPWEVLE
jgi:putative transposase